MLGSRPCPSYKLRKNHFSVDKHTQLSHDSFMVEEYHSVPIIREGSASRLVEQHGISQ